VRPFHANAGVKMQGQEVAKRPRLNASTKENGISAGEALAIGTVAVPGTTAIWVVFSSRRSAVLSMLGVNVL